MGGKLKGRRTANETVDAFIIPVNEADEDKMTGSPSRPLLDHATNRAMENNVVLVS